ncbi:MAG: hypothetical protein GY906_14040 [bacterium]|nr:hypothetical protein [bacterium]
MTLILSLVFQNLPVAAADFYVDPSHPQASDTNPGTEVLPWLNCPGMPDWAGSIPLTPGDTVFFSNTGTWESATGAAVLQLAGGVTYDGRSWGVGERATLRATAGLSRSVVNLMDDHPNLPTVIRGFEVDAGGHVITGIGVNWPQSSGSLSGAIKRIEDCIVHDVASQSALGQYEYGIVISSGYGGNRMTANVEVLDCLVYAISRGGINVYSANDDPLSHIENVLVQGNEIHTIGLDPDYAGSALPLKNHVKNAVVEFNSVHDTVRGSGISISSHDVGFRGPESSIVRFNIVRNCETMGVLFHVRGDTEVDVYGNLILENTYQGVRFMTVMGTLEVRIYNNTFFRNLYPGWSHEILVGSNDGNIAVLDVSNNLFRADPDTTPIVDEDGDITDHTDNLFFRPGGGTLVRSNGVDYTAATINAWEPTAVAADPDLVNELNLPTLFLGTPGIDARPDSSGLSITTDSPATDTGAVLPARFAGSINSVPRPFGSTWDIGAYELVPDLIFADDFESGTTNLWSAINP